MVDMMDKFGYARKNYMLMQQYGENVVNDILKYNAKYSIFDIIAITQIAILSLINPFEGM